MQIYSGAIGAAAVLQNCFKLEREGNGLSERKEHEHGFLFPKSTPCFNMEPAQIVCLFH